MYGVQRLGEDNPMYGKRREKCGLWKGGRKVRKDGYVLIAVPEDYPHPCDSHKTGLNYALEHRVVMEKKLGRYLTSEEVVHHKDFNPSNNDPDNLELFANQQEHALYHQEIARGV